MAYVHASVDYMSWLVLRVLARKLNKAVSDLVEEAVREYIRNRFGGVEGRCGHCLFADNMYACVEECVCKGGG